MAEAGSSDGLSAAVFALLLAPGGLPADPAESRYGASGVGAEIGRSSRFRLVARCALTHAGLGSADALWFSARQSSRRQESTMPCVAQTGSPESRGSVPPQSRSPVAWAAGLVIGLLAVAGWG